MTELEIIEAGLKVVGALFVGYSVFDNIVDWIIRKREQK